MRGKVREGKKRSRSDDQKQFARGLAWSTFGKEREDRARVRLASFYAALCLRPLDSYLSDAPPFIFELSIPLSPCVARNPTPLREVGIAMVDDFSTRATKLWNRIGLRTHGSWRKAALWETASLFDGKVNFRKNKVSPCNCISLTWL
jgi:hypothetical protein